MRNSRYEGDFQPVPMPERLALISVDHDEDRAMLSMGIKTVTHDRCGLKLTPHRVVAIETKSGDELHSFAFSAAVARDFARSLTGFADCIELASSPKDAIDA